MGEVPQELVDLAIKALAKGETLNELAWQGAVLVRDLTHAVTAEQLRRGVITIHDLTPIERRAHVDPLALDLHAIAAGPIMQPGELFLPAGRISLAETRAREAAQVLA